MEGHYGRIPMLNTFASQKPTPPSGTDPKLVWGRSFGNILAEYSGAAFAEDYSLLGALVIACSGGHGGWWGNDGYAADLSSLTWTRLVDPSPLALAKNQRDVIFDREWGELPDGTPAVTGHIYDSAETVPRSWGVTGPKGAFVKLASAVDSPWIHAHSLDLAEPVWRRFTPEKQLHKGSALYPMSARDDKRQCFYVAQGSQMGANHYWKIDKHGAITKMSGGFGVGAAVQCMGYSPELDLLIAMGSKDNPDTFGLRRPDSSAGPFKPGASGQRPTYAGANGAHPEWDPDRHCFCFWDPLAETIYKLRPPDGDPLTQPWSWSTEVLQKSAVFPPTVIRNAAGGQWSKFRRIPALKAFVYPASMTELQIVRPKGA
jgi:hypothetical protein